MRTLTEKVTKPKTLEDFPHFVANSVTRGATNDNGYIRFEYAGKFDRQISESLGHWFYLLFGERDSVCATLKSMDESGSAILTCDEKDEPDIMGKPAIYLSSAWSPYQVWMAAEPQWRWERKTFKAVDAIAEDFTTKDVSLIAGREVKTWTRLQPKSRDQSSSRYYPAADDSGSTNVTPRTVSGGWNHEYCRLCREHIDAGTLGYCDPSEHWVCEKCYARYVVPHDLAFVDEL